MRHFLTVALMGATVAAVPVQAQEPASPSPWGAEARTLFPVPAAPRAALPFLPGPRAIHDPEARSDPASYIVLGALAGFAVGFVYRMLLAEGRDGPPEFFRAGVMGGVTGGLIGWGLSEDREAGADTTGGSP